MILWVVQQQALHNACAVNMILYGHWAACSDNRSSPRTRSVLVAVLVQILESCMTGTDTPSIVILHHTKQSDVSFWGCSRCTRAL